VHDKRSTAVSRIIHHRSWTEQRGDLVGRSAARAAHGVYPVCHFRRSVGALEASLGLGTSARARLGCGDKLMRLDLSLNPFGAATAHGFRRASLCRWLYRSLSRRYYLSPGTEPDDASGARHAAFIWQSFALLERVPTTAATRKRKKMTRNPRYRLRQPGLPQGSG